MSSIDEIFAGSNNYAKLYKYLEKTYVLPKDVIDNPYKIFYGLPFYRFDLSREEHLKLYDEKKGRCCWNHFVGLPEKHGKKLPLFEYQKIIYEDFHKAYVGDSRQKLFAVLKATGLGITEYSVRLMAWLASTSGNYHGQRFAIIAGIRMNISEEIIRRLIKLFDKFTFLNIKRNKAKTMINNVMIEGYPAENVDSLRSFDNLAFILVDEADFFQRSLQKEVRTVVERYIAKTNPYVYLVSTPNKPYGLFYEIFSKDQKDSIYKLYRFNYEWGLGTIFTKKEIEDQKRSDNFQQEYNLQFGGTIGNLFSQKAIDKNIYTLEQAEKIGFAPYFSRKDIQDDSNGEGQYYPRSLGIDPGFGRDPKKNVGSYTALTLTQQRNGRIELLYAEELIQPDFDELVDIASVIIGKTGTTKVYVDGSNPAFVRAMKNAVGEYPKYGDYSKEEIERKIYHGNMLICPIAFNTAARAMMYDMKEFVDKGLLVIREDQKNIIDCFKSAVVINEKLDKDSTAHDDLFDSTRLALRNYRITPKVIA